MIYQKWRGNLMHAIQGKGDAYKQIKPKLNRAWIYFRCLESEVKDLKAKIQKLIFKAKNDDKFISVLEDELKANN